MSDSFHNLCSISNLRQAWLRVEESDGCAGIDTVSISRFGNDLDTQLSKLRQELLNGSYNPLPLLQFFVPKNGGGERALSVAVVRDRVAQHAVIQFLEPLFESEFEVCSFAYRRGRSVKQALNHVEFLRDSGFNWVVEADITSYFDNVDHEILFNRVAEIVKDERILHLIKLWVKARVYDGRRLWRMEKGLPQGAPISPYLANLYLDRFDEEMLESGRKLVRFADDFLILCKTKPKAEAALRITKKLMMELKLTLKEEKTRITNFAEGFKYLGAVFTHSFCLIQSPKPREKGKVEMPSPLPWIYENPRVGPVFNTAMQEALKEALASPENEIIPSCFKKEKTLPIDNSEQEKVMNTEKEETTSSEQINPQSAICNPQLEDFVPPALFTLRTLYVHEHGAVIRCEQERIEVVKDDVELLSLPLYKIEQLVLFGNSQITTTVMKRCMKNGIPILLFSGQGRFLGSIESHESQNVILHQQQFEKLNDADFALDIARRIVAGKIINSRMLLQRRARKATDETFTKAVSGLKTIADSLSLATTLDEVRGYEGAASAAYFKGFGNCIIEPFSFTKRTRRPPEDPINCLLSFGYAMLFQNIHALVRARGLSPFVGYLHALRQGHPALCSDLIEEFRAPIVDALVTSVVNKKMLKPEDFFYLDRDEDDEADDDDNDATVTKRSCRMTDAARKKFIVQFEQRINTQIKHKQAGLRTTWRGCIDLQIGHFIKVLRGEAEHYRPIEFV